MTDPARTIDDLFDRCKASGLPRIAMVSTHGYVAAQPPLGKADTGGQVVYVSNCRRNWRTWATRSTSGPGASRTSPRST